MPSKTLNNPTIHKNIVKKNAQKTQKYCLKKMHRRNIKTKA